MTYNVFSGTVKPYSTIESDSSTTVLRLSRLTVYNTLILGSQKRLKYEKRSVPGCRHTGYTGTCSTCRPTKNVSNNVINAHRRLSDDMEGDDERSEAKAEQTE